MSAEPEAIPKTEETPTPSAATPAAPAAENSNNAAGRTDKLILPRSCVKRIMKLNGK